MPRILPLAFLLFSAPCALAQPNTVTLLDAGGAVLSTHSSVQSAYNAIVVPLTAPAVIEISAAYTGSEEARPLTFDAKSGAADTARITIRPATGVSEVPFFAAADSSPAVIFDGGSYITFDGTAATPDGRAFRLSSTTGGGPTQHPTFLLIGGASANILRGCRVEQGVADGTGLRAADAASLPLDGNLVENCEFVAGRCGLEASPGTSGLRIRKSLFSGTAGAAVDILAGASGVEIDSNLFRVEVIDRQPAWGIRAALADDTLRITRNRIFFSAYARDSATTGIGVEAGPATGPATYTLLTNNFIATAPVPLSTPPAGSFFGTDSFQHLTAISIGGSGAGAVGIFHNTVALRGGQTHPTGTGTEGSAVLRVEATAANAVDIRANILINERSGGAPGTRHAIFSADPATGVLSTDYNTYGTAAGPFASAGIIAFPTMADWAAAAGGSDPFSNTAPVQFEGPDDYRLHSSMAGVPDLAGMPLPGIVADLGGDARMLPYRGADEYVVSCPPAGPPVPAIRLTPDGALCGSGAVWGTYGSAFGGNGIVHRWQSRPLGSTVPFADIIGADETTLYLFITASTEFRIADSCVAGGPVVYSAPDTVIVNPTAQVDSIGRLVSGPTTVDFTAYPATGGLVWTWSFGDGTGTTTTGPAVTHTYGAEAVYTVEVVATNGCGSDTSAVQFVLGLEPPAGLASPSGKAGLRVYPNPARDAVVVEGAEEGADIILHDATGRTVMQWTATGRRTVCALPAGLPRGVYALRVGGAVTRIVKE